MRAFIIYILWWESCVPIRKFLRLYNSQRAHQAINISAHKRVITAQSAIFLKFSFCLSNVALIYDSNLWTAYTIKARFNANGLISEMLAVIVTVKIDVENKRFYYASLLLIIHFHFIGQVLNRLHKEAKPWKRSAYCRRSNHLENSNWTSVLHHNILIFFLSKF